MKRTLELYKSLPYSRRAEGIHEGEGPPYWVAWIEELPGCKTDGATHAEAMLNLDAAFDDYIEAMLEFESDIPVPQETKDKPKVSEVTEGELQLRQEPVFDVEASAEDSTDESAPPISSRIPIRASAPPKSLGILASSDEWALDEEMTTTEAPAHSCARSAQG